MNEQYDFLEQLVVKRTETGGPFMLVGSEAPCRNLAHVEQSTGELGVTDLWSPIRDTVFPKQEEGPAGEIL